MLVLQFISGVYLQFSQLPEWLQNIASVFPLKWMAQGMRAVFLPDDFEVLEQHGEWDLGWVAVALLVWLVVGLVAEPAHVPLDPARRVTVAVASVEPAPTLVRR